MMMRINNKFCREKTFVCFSQLLLPSPNNPPDQLLTGISADAPKANNYMETIIILGLKFLQCTIALAYYDKVAVGK
jgi:hypothetical protein